ncbi:hypothetical protein BGZ94_007480, partial [Podila epigama]
FKHRSQKLLRVWTFDDAASHAIQWKLRLRSKNVAEPWMTNRRHGTTPGSFSQQRDQSLGPEVDQNAGLAIQTFGHEDHVSEQLSGHVPSPQSSTAQVPAPTGATAGAAAEVPPSISIPSEPALPPPSHGSDRRTTSTVTYADSDIRENVHRQRQRHPFSRAVRRHSAHSTFSTAPLRTRSDASFDNEPTSSQQSEPPRIHPISRIVANLKDLSCCRWTFREEKRHWMIEIAIRDYQVDEYSIMVPSPVYCDYRLPQYEDVMAIDTMSSHTGGNNTYNGRRLAGPASSSQVALQRYAGMPPAYDSGSDNESQDGDSEAEDMEDEDDNERSGERAENNMAAEAGTNATRRNEVVIVVDRAEDQRGCSEQQQSSQGPTVEGGRSLSPSSMVMVSRLGRPSDLATVIVLGPSTVDDRTDDGSRSASSSSSFGADDEDEDDEDEGADDNVAGKSAT